MENGKQCPTCSAKIGYWHVVRSKWPNRVVCPECSKRLAYRGYKSGIALSIALIMILGGVAIYVFLSNFTKGWILTKITASVAIYYATVYVVNFGASFFYREYGILEVFSNEKSNQSLESGPR